jgi:thiol:disulfide interchange protein DsbG
MLFLSRLKGPAFLPRFLDQRSVQFTLLAALAISFSLANAYAGNGGNNVFGQAETTLVGYLQGSLGIILAITFFAVGVAIGIARQSLFAIAMGIGQLQKYLKLAAQTAALLTTVESCQPVLAQTTEIAPSVPPSAVAKEFLPGAHHITDLSRGDATIIAAFHAAPGLDGYAIALSPGHDLIVYTTVDGKYLFIGGLFGPDGRNLSADFSAKYLPSDLSDAQADNGPPPATVSAVALSQAAASLHHFTIGDAGAPKHITMFIDPNCIYCKLTYDGLTPYISAKTLQVTIIPVAFLKPTSMTRAGEILDSAKPQEALAINETQFDTTNEEGGLPASGVVSNQALSKIQDNTDFFKEHSLGGTPYLIYPTGNGGMASISGMPSSIADFVAQIPSKGTPSPVSTGAV